MQNNRSLLLAILVNISQLELCRQAEIKLASGQCILVSYSWLYIYIKLRTIESSLTNLLCILDSKVIHNVSKSIFCLIPHLIIIMILCLICRISQRQNAAIICDTKILVGTKDQINNI